jgi:hypothetical protein
MKLQEWQMQQQFEQMRIEEEAARWKNEMKMDVGFEQAKLSY